jgi:hypothetical protein
VSNHRPEESTGAPGSPQRTWAEKDGRSPTIAFTVSTNDLVLGDSVFTSQPDLPEVEPEPLIANSRTRSRTAAQATSRARNSGKVS